MAFDVSAGLSTAGAAVAATAGAMTLEDQKADLEMQKVKLADQLLGAREEKGRAFTTSEREATQGFTSGENAANRTNAVQIANIGADAAVKSAGIHAGGTIAAAQIGAASRDKELDAMKPVREAQIKAYDAETLGKSVATESQRNILESRKELDAALTSGDQTKIKDAQMKNYAAEFSAKEEVQRASVYQAQAKLIESALAAAQARLVALQDPAKSMTPESQALAKTLDLQVKRLQTDLNTAISSANDAIKNLPTFAPTGGGGVDLNKYMKPAAAPPITGQPAPSSLLNGASP